MIDLLASFLGLLILSPILLPVMFIIWRQDGSSPFYVAVRTGKDENPFKMIKLRSMIKNADKTGVDSTGATDQRITPVGHFIRRFKLDELTQLYNVLIGDMSLVGPRPNVKRETDLYTDLEKQLLSIKPGITDFASIVFSDEGDILSEYSDPDIAYNQLIRPGKSHLGLFYIKNQSLILDVQLCFFTILAIFSKAKALQWVCITLRKLGADEKLIELASRRKKLEPMPPPGSTLIVTSRDINSFHL